MAVLDRVFSSFTLLGAAIFPKILSNSSMVFGFTLLLFDSSGVTSSSASRRTSRGSDWCSVDGSTLVVW